MLHDLFATDKQNTSLILYLKLEEVVFRLNKAKVLGYAFYAGYEHRCDFSIDSQKYQRQYM